MSVAPSIGDRAEELQLRALGQAFGLQAREITQRVLLLDGRGGARRPAAVAACVRVCMLATISAVRAISGEDRARALPMRREAWEALGELATARSSASAAEVERLCERWRVECESALARAAADTGAAHATLQRAHAILAATLTATFGEVGEALAAG